MHFSRSWPSNSWWQTMVGWQVLSRPSAAEGGGRRTAFTGPAIQPYSATEVDGWQHELSRVSQNRAAVQRWLDTLKSATSRTARLISAFSLKSASSNSKSSAPELVLSEPPLHGRDESSNLRAAYSDVVTWGEEVILTPIPWPKLHRRNRP